MPTLDPVSPQALAIAHLFVAILIIMGGVFLIVGVWLIVNIVSFRARPGTPDPPQYYGSAKLERLWTAIPALLLVVIFGITVQTMGLADPPIFAANATAAELQQTASPDIVVIGHQFFWEVRYPKAGVVTDNELHLPVGRRLHVQLRSADVIHSLALPQLNGHTDLIPGQINDIWLEADRPGVYLGHCQEFCGTSHAWMLIQAVAQPPAQYDAWLRQQQQAAKTPAGGDALAGYQLFMGGTCRDCHAIAGTPANANVGPNLTHFASRGILGGGVLDNNAQNVARWLTDPQAVKPGNHMPDFQLSADQVRVLTAYMESLR